jgi:hypothetical protein
VIEGLKAHSKDPESDISELMLSRKTWDKDRPHRKLISFSRKWIEQWVKTSNECDDNPNWYLDSETWYAMRQDKKGNWVNMEDMIPCEFKIEGDSFIIQTSPNGPIPPTAAKRRAYLKMLRDFAVVVPISEIMLVHRR